MTDNNDVFESHYSGITRAQAIRQIRQLNADFHIFGLDTLNNKELLAELEECKENQPSERNRRPHMSDRGVLYRLKRGGKRQWHTTLDEALQWQYERKPAALDEL